MRQGLLIGDKYRLERLIGDGASGEVWAARNERTDREVALKLITQADRELRERAVREARVLGRVSHRNVIEVLDAGETDRGDPFLVMPRLAGETLGVRLKRERRLAPGMAASIAAEVALGLAAAHAVGVIHRDLKPNNIFLHRDPETGRDLVKVLDFGVSKMLRGEGPPTTRTGDIVGSPAYMSPEQARADRTLDQRTDLWSLGVVLFEMLAGRRPFSGKGISVISDIVTAPIPSVTSLVPGLDPRLVEVVSRCLERDVSRRIQSAQELAALLLPLAGAEGAAGSADSRRQPQAPAIVEEETTRGDEDQIPTVHGGPRSVAGPPPSSGSGFRPVPNTLLDSSRPSQLWRQAMAVARASEINHPSLLSAPVRQTPDQPEPPAAQPAPGPPAYDPTYAPSPAHDPATPPPPPPRARLGKGALVLLGAGGLLTLAVLVALVIGLGKWLESSRAGDAAVTPSGTASAK